MQFSQHEQLPGLRVPLYFNYNFFHDKINMMRMKNCQKNKFFYYYLELCDIDLVGKNNSTELDDMKLQARNISVNQL